MAGNGWDEMAAWWDAKQGDQGDLWHRTLIDPPVLRLVGVVRGLRLLDLACGNGYLSRRFAREGAQVTAVDATGSLIAHARRREAEQPLGITYHVAEAAHLAMLGTGTFDLIVCNMALMDIEDASSAIQEAARVLCSRGRLVASLSHPCFDKVDTSGWSIDYVYPVTTVWRKMRRYREIETADVPWQLDGGTTVSTRAYHRPLSWYVRVLRGAGLVVTALEEPEPDAEFLAASTQGSWIADVPLHCVVEALKVEVEGPVAV
jgi:ubiquinone/menaquinone biosynthesis C-methylase UbiE